MFPSIYYPSYEINLPKFWFVCDEPTNNIYYPSQDKKNNQTSLLFHIDKNDYFSTLATILRFYEESINDKNITPETRELQLKTIKNVMSDLLYLNKNYTITPKYEKSNQTSKT